MQRCSGKTELVYEAFSYLLYSNNAKQGQCKAKLINYLQNNSTKFDLYLKQNTEFDDIDTYLNLLKTQSMDNTLEFVCLLAAYHHNLKILYNSGESLKEKLLYASKNSSENTSSKLHSEENDEYLIIFMNGSEMIPLLPKDLDESDTSSEISAELENVPSRNIIDKINIENFTSENTEDFEQENVVQSMNKLVDEEFETKLKIESNNKIFQQFESYEDEEAPLFEEIWKRPSDSENEPNLNQNKLFEQTAGTHSSKVPSDLVNDSEKF